MGLRMVHAEVDGDVRAVGRQVSVVGELAVLGQPVVVGAGRVMATARRQGGAAFPPLREAIFSASQVVSLASGSLPEGGSAGPVPGAAWRAQRQRRRIRAPTRYRPCIKGQLTQG